MGVENQPNLPSEPTPDTRHLRPHVFLSPTVIEVHLQNGVAVSPELAKLIWAINCSFEPDDFI